MATHGTATTVSVFFTWFVVSAMAARSRVGIDMYVAQKCVQVPDQLALQSCGSDGFTGLFHIPTESEAPALTSIDSTEISVGATTDISRIVKKITKADCHATCQAQIGCSYWQFVSIPAETTGSCFIYTVPSLPICESTAQHPSSVGTRIRPSIEGDPHLVGARGTRFDFEGTIDDTYCLSTDKMLHVNIFLGGYEDYRVLQGKYAKGSDVRSWIQKIGIIWSVNGVEHKLLLDSRRGVQVARGEGFMEEMALDGKVLPRMQDGEELELAGGLTISLVKIEYGTYKDIDWYSVKIADLLDIDVRLTVADEILRTATDAEVHFGLGFNFVKRTSQVHGILGQTYRENEGREERAEKFIEMERIAQENIIADGPSGNGFLDGEKSDYKSSSILSPDCRFSAYGSQNLPPLGL